jgi:hypothetical protein
MIISLVQSIESGLFFRKMLDAGYLIALSRGSASRNQVLSPPQRELEGIVLP